MKDSDYKQFDFEHPSFLFTLEDKLKVLLGGPLFYAPYYRTFKLKGNENVLDFGCGGGVGSRCLAESLKDGHLVCTDVSHYWITIARKRLKKYANVKCIAGDIREIDLPDGTFDVISAFHVIHDIAPAARPGIVKALSQKLKAGGIFFIREPIKESHGMPVKEIQTLLSGASLEETEYKKTKSEYMGVYRKSG